MAMSVFMIILLVPLVVGVVVMLRSSMGRRVLAGVGLAVLVLVGGLHFSRTNDVVVMDQRGSGRTVTVEVQRGSGSQVASGSLRGGQVASLTVQDVASADVTPSEPPKRVMSSRVNILIVLLIPLLALLVWGVIAMLKSRTGRQVLAGVGLAVLVLVGGVFFSTPRRFEVAAERGGGRLDAVVVERGAGYQVARVSSEAGPTGAVWSAGLEAQFAAEPYSSAESAARALGRQLAQDVRQAAGQTEGPVRVYLEEEQPHGGSPGLQWERKWFVVYDALAEAVTEHAGENVGVKLERFKGGPDAQLALAEGDVKATVSLEVGGYEPGPEGRLLIGKVHVLMRGPRGDVSRYARFVRKKWVADLAGYMNDRRGRSFLVGRSQETAMHASEAHLQAMVDAKAQVEVLLGDYGANGKPVQVSWGDIERHGLVVDKFVQSLQTTTGKVYREAVLLDVSADKLNRLEQRVLTEVGQLRRSWAGRVISLAVSLAGMLGVIVAVYLFLNAATKGYYTWALRIGMVVLALGLGCLVLLVWA